jgi:ferredoxin/flavodoxin---NADP+ reductase
VVLDVDMLIVGAGPTGLYGAYYAGFRGLSVAVVDSLEEPGGQLTALYPEKMIYDVAGLPAVRSRDLVADLVRQADVYSPRYLLGRRAEGLILDDLDGPLTVTLDNGDAVRAKAALVTAGMGTFSPRPLPAGTGYEGRGLRFFVKDPLELSGLDVVVVGGGDSALDWALGLEPLARTVTLVHRRAGFRAHEATVQQLRSSSVEVLTPYEVAAVGGDGGGVATVTVEHHDEPARRTLPCQALVAALGFTAELGPLAGWGMALDHRHIAVDTHMATTVPRVFAAGDIVEYPGKVRLISVGFGEAATAVNNAASVIDPSLKLFPGHSSDPAKAPA